MPTIILAAISSPDQRPKATLIGCTRPTSAQIPTSWPAAATGSLTVRTSLAHRVHQTTGTHTMFRCATRYACTITYTAAQTGSHYARDSETVSFYRSAIDHCVKSMGNYPNCSIFGTCTSRTNFMANSIFCNIGGPVPTKITVSRNY